MHAERKITIHSHKHSFTPYPSLSPYRRTDRWRDTYTRCAWAGGNYFPVVLLCHFLVLVGNRFWFTYLSTQSTIQLWCCVSCLVAAGNSFWCYVHTQCTIQLCCCVSFLVVVENSSQNENTLLRRKKSIPIKTYVREKHVESILGTCKNMTKKRIQFEYLQGYSHDCFSKISRTFCASRNK